MKKTLFIVPILISFLVSGQVHKYPYDLKSSNAIEMKQAMGSGIIAETMDGDYCSATIALTDAQVRYMPVWVTKDATVTSLVFYMKTQGSYTGDQTNQVGLYTFSSGVLTRVATSTNNANLWTASANTWLTVNLSSTYYATKGLYFVGVLWNASATTTAPGLLGFSLSNATQGGYDFATGVTVSGTQNSQNSLPSSVTMNGSVSQASAKIYCYLK